MYENKLNYFDCLQFYIVINYQSVMLEGTHPPLTTVMSLHRDPKSSAMT